MTETPSWQDLLDLLAQLDASGIESAHIDFGDATIRISRSGPVGGAADTPASCPPPALAETPRSRIESAQAARSAAPDEAAVEAPIIGVFYRAPSPGSPPFVEPGQTVEADTTIGIIEVMKLMNPVAAGVAGTLRRFAVADGAQVEFGQTLAFVAPAG